jgi:2-polyprenyl-6-methoxyphenol hydroxylase-like FAD-dependent oxidoreductase
MDHEVIVAGAGPVGLMLACELALGGTDVLVLERRTEIDPTIKAGAITLPSIEALYRRGFLPRLQEAVRTSRERMLAFLRQRSPDEGQGPQPPRIAGHFGGIMLSADRVDVTDPDFAARGPVEPGVGVVSQQQLEEILAERAAELGVDVRRGTELTGLDADDDGVTATITGGRRVRAGWLVGCDGGRSTVRSLAGFDFPGTGPEITGHQALVEIDGAEGLGIGWNCTERGVYVYGPMPGRILTVEFTGPPDDRDAPVTAGELQASIRNVSGVDVTIGKVITATRFTDNARQVTSYRNGRVLLAGDAAHVHSPFGAQGLNLGIGDAMNLGWKLGGTVRGWAPDGLLDTYTAERHPVGKWVLEWTRAQVALMRPEPKERAMRAVVNDLIATTTGTTYFAKKISGVWQRYDLGGEHPLIGGSAPDLEFAGGDRLGEHLRSGKALLLCGNEKLRALGDRWGDRVQVLPVTSADRPELSGMLVRPDGFVAWAAEGEPDLEAATAVLGEWFGAPSR